MKMKKITITLLIMVFSYLSIGVNSYADSVGAKYTSDEISKGIVILKPYAENEMVSRGYLQLSVKMKSNYPVVLKLYKFQGDILESSQIISYKKEINDLSWEKNFNAKKIDSLEDDMKSSTAAEKKILMASKEKIESRNDDIGERIQALARKIHASPIKLVFSDDISDTPLGHYVNAIGNIDPGTYKLTIVRYDNGDVIKSVIFRVLNKETLNIEGGVQNGITNMVKGL
jgi:hypothetical protein